MGRMLTFATYPEVLRGSRSVMAAVCEVCGKKPSFGMNISHSHRRTKRRWDPNIQKVRAVVDGAPKRLHVCTSCIRVGQGHQAPDPLVPGLTRPAPGRRPGPHRRTRSPPEPRASVRRHTWSSAQPRRPGQNRCRHPHSAAAAVERPAAPAACTRRSPAAAGARPPRKPSGSASGIRGGQHQLVVLAPAERLGTGGPGGHRDLAHRRGRARRRRPRPDG